MATKMDLPEDAGEWCWTPLPRSELDTLVTEMERKWGIGRLPILISLETAAKFRQANDMRNSEWDYAPTERRQALDAMMARAWHAMDAEATQRGASPLPPAVHEIPLEGCPGAVAAICLDDEHAQAVQLRAKAEGRTVSTWTLAEVVRVIQANEVVNRIKGTFPGATARPRSVLVDDPQIPFGGSEDE